MMSESLERTSRARPRPPEEVAMGYTLEQFSSACHNILTQDPGPNGRE